MTEPDATNDPAWDPAVRVRVQLALNHLMFTMQDLLRRHTDIDGYYTAPDPVPFGDVTGLINSGYYQVVKSLQQQLDATKAEMQDVLDEVDRHKRQQFGDGYKPTRKPLA